MRLFIIIFIIAAAFRFFGLNWDSGFHLHPDERMITMVADRLRFPDNLNPQFFAYGSFPIYLLKIAGSLAGLIDPSLAVYTNLNLVGRFLSACFDLGTLLILFLLGKKLFNRTVALLSAGFYASSVLPIQLSHFYAVDTLLTFFVLLTLYLLILFLEQPDLRKTVLIGICFGFALATKTTAVLLVAPIIITILVHTLKSTHKLRHLAVICSLLAVNAFFTFTILEPFAWLDFPNFWRQTLEQQAMTKSAFTFPYTLQYVGKVPYLYELKNIFFFGLGPILAALACLGTIFMAYRVFRPSLNAKYLILYIFFWLYFAVVGSFAIGFMRYMLPLYPLLCLFAAILLYQLHQIIKSHLPKFFLYTLMIIWPLSFLSIYTQPNTRVSATKWVLENIPPGSTLATEHWDDGLPLVSSQNYQILSLPLYDTDIPGKWDKINQTLRQTDYIIVASNRLYVPLPKLTDCKNLPPGRCYPQTALYYQKLFNGTLGFTKVAEFVSFPHIPIDDLRFTIDDFNADESFTVYDHPKVMIYAKLEKP